MKILGIESSCDETSCAVVEDGREVKSCVILSQIEEHKIYGGVVPEIASRRHVEAISGCTRQALEQAGVTLEEIDAIAVTYAPGLIGALLVGVNFAKGLSYSAGKPLVPVHHIRGHIAANYLTHPGLTPPFLCLVASGGHSLLVEVKDYTVFRVIGQTRDDAAGEAFDKSARAMGFGYPGGAAIDRAARLGNPDAFHFPHPRLEDAPFDFSFSGLKTAVINLIHNARQKGEELAVNDLAASFQKTVVDILSDKLMLAAQRFGYQKLALAGGVVANSALRQRLEELCHGTGRRIYMPELLYCSDNAAMIAAQGYFEYLAGKRAALSLNGCASLPIDQAI